MFFSSFPAPPLQVTYVAEDKLVRFSAKLFNCTPAQLPSDLKASLVNMLSCQSMEGYLRPGCVHITGWWAGCKECTAWGMSMPLRLLPPLPVLLLLLSQSQAHL